MERRQILPVLVLLSIVWTSACGRSSGEDVTGPAQETLQLVSGDGQSGHAGTVLPRSIVVEVRTLSGTPVSGRLLMLAATSGGSVAGGGSIVTGPDGRAAIAWRLGAIASASCMQGLAGEAQHLEVAAIDPSSGSIMGPVVARATALTPPEAIALRSFGTSRLGAPILLPWTWPDSGTEVIAVVTSSKGCPSFQAPVEFTAIGGNGTLIASGETNVDGQASFTWSTGIVTGVETLTAHVVGTGVEIAISRMVTLDDVIGGAYAGDAVTTTVNPLQPGGLTNGACTRTVTFDVVKRVAMGAVINQGCFFKANSRAGYWETWSGCFSVDANGAASASGGLQAWSVDSGECTGSWSATRQ